MEPHIHERLASERRLEFMTAAERARRGAALPGGKYAVPRRAVLYPLAACVAIVTAVALLALAAALPSTAAGVPSSSAADEAVVRRFYAALNGALATGDPAALDAVAWPDLVVHRGDGTTLGLVDLGRHLGVLHAAQPGLEVRVDDVLADRQGGVARVTLGGVGDAAMLAVQDDRAIGRGADDRFRIADGRILEYAGVVAEIGVPRPLIDGQVVSPEGESVWLELTRVSLRPGAGFSRQVFGGPDFYAVEAGEIELSLPAASHYARGTKQRLRQGEQTALGADTPYFFRNVGQDGAVILGASIVPEKALSPFALRDLASAPLGEGRTGTAPAAGVAWRYLAGQTVASGALAGPGPVGVTVGRLTLPAGRHTLARPPANDLVVAVESGRAVLVAPAAQAGGADADGLVTILSAGAATTDAGPVVVLDNVGAGPLVLLLVSLSPGETGDGATPPLAISPAPASTPYRCADCERRGY